jgi:hypothetical protein
LIITFLFKIPSFSMIGSFRSSIFPTFGLLTVIDFAQARHGSRVCKRPAFLLSLVSFVELAGEDIPRTVERRQDRIPILSLLSTGRLTFPLLGSCLGSRCKCLSVVLPRSLRMCNAHGAFRHASSVIFSQLNI